MSDLKEIMTELRRLNLAQISAHTLWDVADVAAYLKVSTQHLYNHKVLSRADFPRAVVVPITDERPAKRWRAVEVTTWAQRIREVPMKRRAS